MTPQELRCIALIASSISYGDTAAPDDVLERAKKFEAWLRMPAKPFPWDSAGLPPADERR